MLKKRIAQQTVSNRFYHPPADYCNSIKDIAFGSVPEVLGSMPWPVGRVGLRNSGHASAKYLEYTKDLILCWL